MDINDKGKRWVRPSELDDDLTQTEKETKVCMRFDHMALLFNGDM